MTSSVNLNDSLIAMLQEYRTKLEQVDPNTSSFSVQKMIHEWWQKELNFGYVFSGVPQAFDVLGSAYHIEKSYPRAEEFYKAKAVLIMVDMVIYLLYHQELSLDIIYPEKRVNFSWRQEKTK